ncbi:MAG: YdiU family protein [Acidobacteriota bacterium]|jgi:uncharacterized protein YdiU (UPF0061 family)|nr:MAG: YdiU family protein [Acidobacteriota bacterium]
MSGWRLEHTYAKLPPLFYTPVEPTPVRDPHYVVFNVPLALELGLDVEALESDDGVAIFSGNRLPDGAFPIAQAYAGHQFGTFTALGDGRAILLGEQVAPDGRRVDIQLKGAGQTRYSRRGDGRAALGPMLRELVIGEAMHALGIPTTRGLAVVATGEPVYRERVQQGAVLTRVASSHLRVGTVQWAAAHRDIDALRAIVGYTIDRHYPTLRDAERPALALLDAVAERQAVLIAKWQLVGFVHGVMNTDNMSLAGETIDYGPCAFIDVYDPATVFSSIDMQGRYAFGNQPAIAEWNLARFAEALLPLIDPDGERALDLARASLERFARLYERAWLDGMRAKLGLFTAEDDDRALVDDLLAWMTAAKADFTWTFVELSRDGADAMRRADPSFGPWLERWRARLARQPRDAREVTSLMRRHNPIVVPRNHRVEEALSAAEQGSIAPLGALLDALRDPYDYTRPRPELSNPPPPADVPYRTFCGT